MRITLILIMLLTILGCSNKNELEETIFNIPREYEYYKGYVMRYEGDDQEKVLIPNGEFWGLLRMYHIAGWEQLTDLFENRDEIRKIYEQRRKKR